MNAVVYIFGGIFVIAVLLFCVALPLVSCAVLIASYIRMIFHPGQSLFDSACKGPSDPDTETSGCFYDGCYGDGSCDCSSDGGF